jgi:hypothetical protein
MSHQLKRSKTKRTAKAAATKGSPALALLNVGSRSGPSEALMHNVVERLTDAEMVAIAPYVASLQP